MRKVVLTIFLLPVIALIIFILWMNITPGHFRYTCYCSVKYMTDEQFLAEQNGICALIGLCQPPQGIRATMQKSLISISNLDFTK
jgi:hypothetical protein